jgi:hypothetical protein
MPNGPRRELPGGVLPGSGDRIRTGDLWVMSQPVAIAPNAIRLKRARHDRFARPSPGSSNPAGCNDGHRIAPPARCGNRLADPVRTRGRIHTELKFFPTQAAGRANYLKSIRSARFWPTGGISTTNAAQYLALPIVG